MIDGFIGTVSAPNGAMRSDNRSDRRNMIQIFESKSCWMAYLQTLIALYIQQYSLSNGFPVFARGTALQGPQ